MFALLIAVIALFLAVVVAAVIDPWPSRAEPADDGNSIIDVTALPL